MVLDVNIEKVLSEWLAVRNSIIRSTEAEMRVTYIRDGATEGGEGGEGSPPHENTDAVKGVYVELRLVFSEKLPQDFTTDEKEAVEKALTDELEDKD